MAQLYLRDQAASGMPVQHTRSCARTCSTMTGAFTGACGSVMTSSALAMRFCISSRSAASCARVMLLGSGRWCCCWRIAVAQSTMAVAIGGVQG